jgi:hypothetical protein
VETFTAQLREWQLFYSTVALASVTLAGLLFVSLSLHHEVIKGDRDGRMLRLARGSFGDFLYLLMLGLVFLVPHQAPFGLAVALFALGAARGIGILRQLRYTAGPSAGALAGERKPGSALREIALPALASLGLIVVGLAILGGNMLAMYGLVLVIAALLATASWNAWLILVEEEG